MPKLVAILLDEPDAESPVSIRDRALLVVFAYMAVRVGELHQMNVGNIARDGEHTVIRIKGKGNEWRHPPIAAAAVKAQRTQLGMDKKDVAHSPIGNHVGVSITITSLK